MPGGRPVWWDVTVVIRQFAGDEVCAGQQEMPVTAGGAPGSAAAESSFGAWHRVHLLRLLTGGESGDGRVRAQPQPGRQPGVESPNPRST